MSRIERIEAEIAKQLALVIQQDGVKDPRVKGLISVLRVTVDTELSYAKVYISVLGADGHEQEVVDGLNSVLTEIAPTVSLLNFFKLRTRIGLTLTICKAKRWK